MLSKRLSAANLLEITRWWRSLSSAERRGLRDGGRSPRGVVGRFVEPGDDEPQAIDFYEYLVNHELSLEDGRPFHICSAHEKARAAISAGRLPASFVCPRGDVHCPMRVVLDASPGHDILLRLRRTA